MHSRRIEVAVLAGLCAYTLVPALALRHWWVDDAGIAFGYARNLAHGDGIVAFPGGERTEGYSDPLWVALLALGQLARISPFPLSKILGALFAAACVPLSWDIARRTADLPPRLARAVPLIAAALVATNAQQLIWAGSGLENPLFSLLLALGVRQVLVEKDRRGVPWSALVFLGLALTRTEGIAYATFAVGVAGVVDARRGRWMRTAVRFALLLVPFVLYQLARYEYFALPFPLPTYVKVHPEHFSFFRRKEVKYVTGWATETGGGVMVPAVLIGALGARGLRTLGVERVLCGGLATMTVVFVLAVRGDWMGGYRWFSFLAVPFGVLYAWGIARVVGRASPKVATAIAGVATIVPLMWNTAYVVKYARRPLVKTPFTTRVRVDSFDKIAAQIHLDRPWVAVDHSMGGHLWFAPPGGETIDWFGLTDTRFALHHGKVDGLDVAVLLGNGPARFDFAHRKGGMADRPKFQDQFISIPQGKGRTWADWMNRSLVTTGAWPDESQAVDFASGHTLSGFGVPSPEVHAGGGLYVEIGLERDEAHPEPFGLKVFLVGPARAVFDAKVGYGDLFPPASWRPGEIFVGRYAFELPADLPDGRYAIGFAVVDAQGNVEPAVSAPDDATIVDAGATVGAGEVVFADRITVESASEVTARAEAQWKRAESAVATGDCEQSEAAWKEALEHEPLDKRWARELDRRAAEPLSGCWARRAEGEPTLDAQLEDLRRARRWDVQSQAALAVGTRIADATWPLAMAARERDDVKTAFTLFDAVVTADPSRSWARRYAEDARSELLTPRAKNKRHPSR